MLATESGAPIAQACGEPWAAGLGNREVKEARKQIAASFDAAIGAE